MSLSIKHWSTGMKTAVAAITGVTAIIGAYMTVEAWADDKITEAERRAIALMRRIAK